MQKDTYIQTLMKKMTKIYFTIILFFCFLSGCALSPGMFLSYSNNWDGEDIIFIESLNIPITIEPINKDLKIEKLKETYKIGTGDELTITIWGLPEVFPINSTNQNFNTRRVDSNGNIFFPFVGITKAKNKTQNELRDDLTNKLNKMFKDIQLDLTITDFNSKSVYLLGEITIPAEIKLTDIPLSLSDAIGRSKGLNTNTSEGEDVFVIRQNNINEPRIFRADLSSPAGFISAGNFFLTDNDIVYINAKGTTRWNRVISQFFPFSSFLNSVDNLIDD